MELARQNGTIRVTGKGHLQTITLDFDDDGLQFDLDAASSTCERGDEKVSGEKIAVMVKRKIREMKVTPAPCLLLSADFGLVEGELLVHNAKILLI
jgi:hypothetical protein